MTTELDLLNASIFELIPTPSILDRAAALPHGATISVTASPDKGMRPTIDLAIELAGQGFRVIPHLSARALTSEHELGLIVERLAEAEIDHAFVVGGDSQPSGPFFDAGMLLDALGNIDHPFTSIGVTGYPEGHPSIPDDVLIDALVRKLPHASYIATQMCFDPTTIALWIRRIRAASIDLPIMVGVPGAVDATKLATIGLRIGVGQSLRYFKKNRAAIAEVLRHRGAADELIAHLAPHADELGIAGLHVFTFNAVAATADWHASHRSPTDLP